MGNKLKMTKQEQTIDDSQQLSSSSPSPEHKPENILSVSHEKYPYHVTVFIHNKNNDKKNNSNNNNNLPNREIFCYLVGLGIGCLKQSFLTMKNKSRKMVKIKINQSKSYLIEKSNFVGSLLRRGGRCQKTALTK